MPWIITGILALLIISQTKPGQSLIQEGENLVSKILHPNYYVYGPLVLKYSKQYNVPYNLMCGIIQTESDWDPKSYREEAHLPQVTTDTDELINDGSYGLGQLLYSTAQGLGFSGPPEELFDPDTNLHFMAILLDKIIKQRGSANLNDILATYNSGRTFDNAPTSTRQVYVPITLKHIQNYPLVV